MVHSDEAAGVPFCPDPSPALIEARHSRLRTSRHRCLAKLVDCLDVGRSLSAIPYLGPVGRRVAYVDVSALFLVSLIQSRCCLSILPLFFHHLFLHCTSTQAIPFCHPTLTWFEHFTVSPTSVYGLHILPGLLETRRKTTTSTSVSLLLPVLLIH